MKTEKHYNDSVFELTNTNVELLAGLSIFINIKSPTFY